VFFFKKIFIYRGESEELVLNPFVVFGPVFARAYRYMDDRNLARVPLPSEFSM
jgi:hypothetical protein